MESTDNIETSYKPPQGQLRIMGRGQATSRELAEFLVSGNPDIPLRYARRFALTYIEECRAEGVNWDIAFAQMCLETDYLKYGGQVEAHQNNFCGLGAVDGGVAGASFDSARAGIRAHVQHLKAYASREPLQHPRIDPRFDLVKRGVAPNVSQLTGKWATDRAYAKKITRIVSRLRR